MTRNYHLLLLLLLPAIAFSQERQQLLFNDNWKFYKGEVAAAEKAAFNDAAWRTLQLPHDWSIEGPFSNEWASGTGYLPGGIGWYRKKITPPAKWSGKHVS